MKMDKFKRWLVAAGIRAIKTFAEGMVTLIGTDYISIVDLDWAHMIGISATMALVSLLISVAGLPLWYRCRLSHSIFPRCGRSL